jgi:hypothetical protein
MPRAACASLLLELTPSPLPLPAELIPRVRWVGRLADVVCVNVSAAVGPGEAELRDMHSSMCWVLSCSSPFSPFGGNSLPQTGHSSSSATWRRGLGSCGCWGWNGGGTGVDIAWAKGFAPVSEPKPEYVGVWVLLRWRLFTRVCDMRGARWCGGRGGSRRSPKFELP